MKENKKIPFGYKKFKEVRNMNAVDRAIKEENNKGYNVKFKSETKTHHVGTKTRDIKIYNLYKRKKNIRKS